MYRRFPRTLNEILEVKMGFYEKSHFPEIKSHMCFAFEAISNSHDYSQRSTLQNRFYYLENRYWIVIQAAKIVSKYWYHYLTTIYKIGV